MKHERFSHLFPGSASRLNDAATPYPFALQVQVPNLIACPVHPATMMAVQDIYRIAYEDALASSRTTRFDLAMTACPN